MRFWEIAEIHPLYPQNQNNKNEIEFGAIIAKRKYMSREFSIVFAKTIDR